jgi:outer membrane protein assembly factor BamB
MFFNRSLWSIVALVGIVSSSHAQDREDTVRARWTQNLSNDFWVVNTSITPEYGVRQSDLGLSRDLGTFDSVDTFHSVFLAFEGSAEDETTLTAIDSEEGMPLWKKPKLRLGRWRPFPSFVIAQFPIPAYYAQIVGSTVVVLVTNATQNGFECRKDYELVAMDVRDGRPLWCTEGLPRGDITFVPVPEKSTLLAWVVADNNVTLLAYDLRTGTERWKHVVAANGGDWKRAISYMTGLPAPASARPPLYHNGRVCLLISEAKRFGPQVRSPNQATFKMIDVETGRVAWEVVQPLQGRGPFLSWTFSDRSFILTTGRAVTAFELASGERQWTTPLEDVRSLRVAHGRRKDVALVEFDARQLMQPAPTKRGKGLAAIDLATGALLWRDSDARVLQSIDQVGPAVFIEAGDAVRSLDVETGMETNRLRPAFEDRVRYARYSPAGRTIVQSATELAAYDDGSSQPAFQQTIPRAFRGLTRVLITAVLAPGAVGVQIILEIAAPGITGLRGVDSEQGTRYAFFATGRGRDSRLVAVDTETGKLQMVSPYIYGDSTQFSLGNLLDEPHGLVYTMSGKTIAAYAFEIDQNAHRLLHRRAGLQRALETRDRAVAFTGVKQPVAARREAAAAVVQLESLLRGVDPPARDAAFAYEALGDSQAVLAELASRQEVAEHRGKAIGAYEQALRLLEGATEAWAAGMRADVQRELERVKLY